MAEVSLNKLNKKLTCDVCGSSQWDVTYTESIKTKRWREAYNVNAQVLNENNERLLYCECERCSQVKMFNSQFDIELNKYGVTSEDKNGNLLP